MRMLKWNRSLRLLGAAAVGILVLAPVASASTDVTTEQSGSILVWPKVVWDGTRDTIIEVTNTGNAMTYAHCFYINAAPSVNPCAAASRTNPAQWSETDFDILLTRQQPTHWVASAGRQTSIFDANGTDGAGFDPGLIPPVPMCFRGELKCIETDDSGAPMTANKLIGEATLRSSNGDVSKYNAIAFLGNPGFSGIDIGNDLQLTLSDGNPGGEYSACPETLLLNHFAFGAQDAVLSQLSTCNGAHLCFGGPTPGAACTVNSDCGSGSAGGTCIDNCGIATTVTLVPCQEDLENQIGGTVTAQFEIFNEFEDKFSASTTVNCWLDASLSTMTQNQTTFNVLGTLGAFTRIVPNSGPTGGGLIGIAEEFRRDSGTIGVGAAAAFNLNIEGNRYDAGEPIDHIIIPGDSAQ